MDSKTKLKYDKAKYTVKKWEKEFRGLTSSTPTKADIKNAPSKIREAYRTYWTLKTLALESTISEELLDENAKDCFNSSNETTADTSVSKPAELGDIIPNKLEFEDSVCFQPLSETTLTQFAVDTASQSISDCNLAHVRVENEPLNFANCISQVNTDESNSKCKSGNLREEPPSRLESKGVWGSHLNKDKNVPPNPRKFETKSLSMQYAQKLFNPDKFKNFNKKNPRKPRVFQKAKTTSNLDTKPKFDIPKFEFLGGVSDTGQCSLIQNNSVTAAPSADQWSDDSLVFGEKVKILTKTNPSSVGNAVSLLQKAFNGDVSKSSLTRDVDSAWLDRIEQDAKRVDPLGLSQDSGLSSGHDLSQGLSASQPGSGSDSEDLIYDSDSESQSTSSLMKSTLSSSAGLSSQLSGCVLPLMNVQKSVSADSTLSTARPIPNSQFSESSSLTDDNPNEKSALNTISAGSSLINNCSEDGKKRSRQRSNTPPAKRAKHDSKDEPSGTLPEIAAASRKRTAPKQVVQKDDIDKKKAALEKKLRSGKANENFVSINIQKKVFVRGKKTTTFSKYKKQKWKQMKQENGSYSGARGVLKCFKCGDVGHFSKACPSDKGLLPLEDYVSDDESAFPTLEQAAEEAKAQGDAAHKGKRKFTQSDTPLNELLPKADEVDQIGLLGSVVQPPYLLKDDGSVMDTPQEVFDCLHQDFGHAEFLDGQELAVMRVLSGKSTLVTLSTGSGKSLCYQLPAAIYSKYNPGCITLVISPLVSLMEDQVEGAGGWDKSACYHTYMTQKRRDKVLDQLRAQELSVLLVSPETLVSLEAGAGKQLLSVLPPIAFACIDEAHCLHQWCHNFRPSYLTVTQVLRERFGIRTLLGLTATASSGTIQSLIGHLGIDPEDRDSLIKDTPLPDNLTLSVSVTHQNAEKQEALLKMLTIGCFAECSSIIIYCTRRETCDKVAAFLRTALQKEDGSNKKGRLSLHAEVYHAGLTAGRRNQVQKAFMSGKLRIVVATVAFGMGINKPDIRGVIHYSLPSTFENYVQEVGRAGRDRKPARCHLFLDSQNEDLGELRRHIYCDTIDRFVIRKLLQFVFVRCQCPELRACPKHEVAFPIDTTVAALDLPQENVTTLLAYLELNERKWIKTLPLAYTKCKVSSYKGPNHLKSVCRKCPPLAVVLADVESSQKAVTSLEFDIFEIARRINWDSGILKKTIKDVEWTTENGKPSKSGILVEFSSLGFRLLAPGNLPDEELDLALDVLTTTVQDHEKAKLKGLEAFYGALSRVSYKSVDDFGDEDEMIRRSATLKEEIREYFTDQGAVDAVELKTAPIINESSVVDDVRQLIVSSKGDHVLTGRTVARILHGIGSPNFPPIVWGRTRFWRLHMNQDFNALCQLANKQLLMFK